MEHYRVELTNEEYEKLNSEYPESNGSGLIGKRAEEIVRIHFRRIHPKCTFANAPSGADLQVVVSDESPSQSIEIKGTASSGIAWQQLKVSSTQSWELLSKEAIPVYRVCAVFSKAPSIYVLRHGRDFVLVPEPRWTFKRLRASGEVSQSIISSTETNDLSTSRTGVRRSSKYDTLREFLKRQTAAEITFHFSDAPEILGFSLPDTAFKYQAYWANQSDTRNRPWAKAWQDAGFEVAAHHLSESDGWVRFRRRR
ncbi:MAG: hypothetical protein FJ123_04380 [Deltaproteobacteria bacterium]|nr:hypothetical protein [Deltaproteobacteria bacterium]